jgi:hypothetical protein
MGGLAIGLGIASILAVFLSRSDYYPIELALLAIAAAVMAR